LMDNKPVNRNESFFSGDLLGLIVRQTLFCSVVVLAGYYAGAFRNVSGTVAPSAGVGQTMAFLICGWTSIIHIFNVRTSKSVFKTPISDNKPLALSAVIMVLLFGLMVVFPSVGQVFGLTAIGGAHWLIVFGFSLVPTSMCEISKLVNRIPFFRERRRKRREFLGKLILRQI